MVAKVVSMREYASNVHLTNWQFENLKRFNRHFCTDRDSVEIDRELLKVLRNYVWNVHDFDDTLNYLYNLRDSDGQLYSQSLKRYKDIADVVAKFSEDDRPSMKGNEEYDRAVTTLKESFPSKRLKSLTYNSDDDVKVAIPKTDAHSGFEYILTGKKQKGEYMDGIAHVHALEEQKAISNGSFGKLILPGTRTQGSGAFDELTGEKTFTCKHKTRMINMVDLYQVISETRYAEPLQNFLSGVEWYAGGKDDSDISRQLSDWRYRYKYFLSIDYSGYDQTVPAWLIQDMFDIIKDSFQSVGPEFDVIVHDFIHKDLLYDGYVYRIDKGVPSGSRFTNSMDSMGNNTAVTSYFNLIGVKDYKMCICGDDNIIFFNEDINVGRLSSYLSRRFGFQYNIKKSDPIRSTREFHPHFLSKYYTWKGPYRNEHVLIARMGFPERHRNYYDVRNYVKPEHVILGYLYAYPQGMEKLINVEKFLFDNPDFSKKMLEYLDTRYLPGSLSYSIEYVDRRRNQIVGRRRRIA